MVYWLLLVRFHWILKQARWLGPTIKEQTNQVLKNIFKGFLTEAYSDFAHVVKTTCYLQNMADFTAFNEVYAEYFSGRNTLHAQRLKSLKISPMDVLEIEIVAEVVA